MKRHRIVSALLLMAWMAVPCFAGALASEKVPSTFDKIVAIRAAYAKLARFNQAERVRETRDPGQFDSPLALRFALSDFRGGDIAGIADTPWTQLSPTEGEVLTVTSMGMNEDGRGSVSYTARWEPGQYSSSVLPRETIGDVLRRHADGYYDVGSYVAYTVTVTFDGKSRTYPALALFHDLYASADRVQPDFWDGVVGLGGALNKVADERRPAFTLDAKAPTATRAPATGSRLQAATESESLYDESCFDYSWASSPSVIDHPKGGFHQAHAVFEHCCSRPTSASQRCTLRAAEVRTIEDPGSPTNLTQGFCWTSSGYGNPACYFTFHVGSADQEGSGHAGPAGSPVSCSAGIVAGWKRCTDPRCLFEGKLNVDVSLKSGFGGGFDFSVPATALDNVKWVESSFCNLTPQTNNPCHPTQVTDDPFGNIYEEGGTSSPPCNGGSTGGSGTGSGGGGGGGGGDPTPIDVYPSACMTITVNASTVKCCADTWEEVGACIAAHGG